MSPPSQSLELSCEYFPTKTQEGWEKLRVARDELKRINPVFYSCTFGAGGSTREGTIETVRDIIDKDRIPAAPHISCIGASQEGIGALLNSYTQMGVERLVVLRGDYPSGMVERGPFNFANELVAFIRKETGDQFFIEVAAYPEFHPQAVSCKKDLENLKRKVDAGANSAITQYFYNSDAYVRFLESCNKLNINIPIVPGVMPITNYTQLVRFSDQCGAEIPRWIRLRLEDYQDDLPSLREFGLEVMVKHCEQLISVGALGLHFYTLNRAWPTLAIVDALGLEQNQ